MTLCVDAYTRDENGKAIALPLQSDLAGFESTRQTFYGGERAIAAGLVLLPTLANQSQVDVSGPELLILRKEVELLKAGLSVEEMAYWNFRLNNILAAIDAALPYGDKGFVSIS